MDADRFLDKLVYRAPEFDDMENATELELMTKQWQEGGWYWRDWNFPSVEESTDDDFIHYYTHVYGGNVDEPYRE